MEMDNTLLEINKATVKGINGVIFNNLDFTIKAGEHWAIIGESGSGKTALLQTIAGSLNVTSGSITYNFLSAFKNSRDGTPLKFQDYIAVVNARHHFKNLSNTHDLYYQQRFNSSDSENTLTVREYLQNIKTRLSAGKYWNILNSTALLGLDALLDKQVIKLSNGETRRLLIAAALLKNPVILLMDNPLAGLDVSTRNEFNSILKSVASSGISIIMTVSAHELMPLVTHVAVLKDRQIIQATTRNELLIPFDDTTKASMNEDALKELFHNFKNQKITLRLIVGMKDVTVRYGKKIILNKVNWQVLPGERWALSGPNGAGKSTLLSLINGDNPQAYANNIILFDKQRGTGESIWDIKSKIGFVSPELHQYFPGDNSCLQVIESGFYDTLGLFRPSVWSKAGESLRWMQAFDIDKYARHLLKNIPSGAQRLCLLARALVNNPPLLIFDEPCQGLDSSQQHHFKNIIDTICRISNVTLIYVTHYPHEIPHSVTNMLRLENGSVVST